MKRALMILTAGGAIGLLAAGAYAQQSLGGFPIHDPGVGRVSGQPATPKGKGQNQIVVDANGQGPYKKISMALDDIAEGGVIYVMHGDYEESVTLSKSVFIQGDRGPGPGVRILPKKDNPCLSFSPKESTAHAVVANVELTSAVGSEADGCVNVLKGVFTLKESNVFGSGHKPAIKISGGTVMLEKNTINGGASGVLLELGHSLAQTFLIDNEIAKNEIGVDISDRSFGDVFLAGNQIFENRDGGVRSFGHGGATFIGNKISNNDGAGIVLDRHAKLALVRYNEIVQNDGDGLAAPFGSNGFIEHNKIMFNKGKALSLGKNEKPELLSNEIACNEGDRGKGRKDRRCR
ncbi:MAG: right-handed parallel beta-helix repeat-containing protein [Parvularculaceae bacterium]